MLKGAVVSVNVSASKGERKKPVGIAKMTAKGFEGDAHSGDWHRQVSLLGIETIEAFRPRLATIGPGDFAENVTTSGIDWHLVKIGDRVAIGTAVVEVTQIGKECHSSCEIRRQVGDCVMPKEGIFAKVIEPGKVEDGDVVEARTR